MKEEPPNRTKMQEIDLEMMRVMFGVANEYDKEKNIGIKNDFFVYTVCSHFEKSYSC